MSSQQYKLEKLVAAKAAGKRAVVKVNGVPYTFGGVLWGGTSPRVRDRSATTAQKSSGPAPG